MPMPDERDHSEHPLSKGNTQCPAVFGTHRGTGMVFCTKREGHEGDHRGYRKQWDDKGNPKPITEKHR